MANDIDVNIAWRVAGLNYTYPDGTSALHGVELSVAKGDKVALVGANGAGKSTLFLCALGILEGWTGRISFGGLQASAKTLDELRRRVGLVFQEPDDMLFMPTVWDDAAFGPINAGLNHDEVHERVEKALKQVGMWELRSRPAHHLSAGEKRKASLAAVLSTGAETLLLDEPTSGLDPKARRGFMKLIGELPLTAVIATHDLSMAAEVTDKTIVLHEGRVMASGLTKKLLYDEELMEKNNLEVPG
jgi:cobalt/nickel transport system ATP-binding protein